MIDTLPTIDELPARDDEAGFGTLATPLGNLPLKALDIRARIDGLLARTLVRQTFANAFAVPLEATYIFPLPDRAAVTRFVLKVGPRVVEGRLQERSKARSTYEQALRDGHRAAIAEEERPNVFTMRVGNLPPGEAIAVELTLTGPIPVDHGEATFRFPLVVAPRYIPGIALDGDSVCAGTQVDTDAVPDASRISPPVLLPGQPNPVRLGLSVEIHPGRLNCRELQSSLHAVREDSGDHATRIRLNPGERLDRDFILRWRIDANQIRSGLHFQPDTEDSTSGTFAITIVPPSESMTSTRPRDIVFVLDRSGSMEGWKMLAARRALARMIDSLTDRDRFAVLAFDEIIEPFPTNMALETATDRQRFRAVEFLAKIESRGGTELAAPLQRSLDLLGDAGRERVLVLVTDGQVGNEDQILRALSRRLAGVRVFTLGIDMAVNEGFLKRLAGLGGGYTELVESEDRLDAVMDKVHRRICAPLLSGLKLKPAGLPIEPELLAPSRLPDLFPGTPLVILGRYQGYKHGAQPSLRIQARDETGAEWTETLLGESGDVLTPVWARSHLRDLEDRYASDHQHRAELEQRILTTSLKYSVLCRFTAFVAVDIADVVNQNGVIRQIIQPVESPAGWEMLQRQSRALSAPTFASMPLCRAAPPDGEDCESVDSMLMEFDAAVPVETPPPVFKRSVPARSARISDQSSTRPALDLAAYRERARELKDRLELAKDAQRELAVLRVRLEELIDDMKSVGASEPNWKPLAELLTALQVFLGAASRTATESAAMKKQALDVLAGFATVTAKKRRRWW